MKISWIRGNNEWAFKFLTDDLAAALPAFDHLFNETAGADVYFITEPALFSWIAPTLWNRCVLHLDSMRVLERSVDYRRQMIGCGAIIAGNSRLLAAALAVNPKSYLIPNGLNLAVWPPIAQRPEKFTVGFCGSLKSPAHIEYKGFNLVEQVCRMVNVPLHTAVYGENQIPHDKMREDFYGRISCLLHPTRGEGCSCTLMEALACGIPVLTTREAGYHGDNLRDGVDCLFIERGIPQIKARLELLMGSDQLQSDISRGGWSFAQNRHGLYSTCHLVEAVFRDVAGQPKGAQAGIEPKPFVVDYGLPHPNRPGMEAPARTNTLKYKPRIVVYVDDKQWCYYTTVRELVKRLSDEFDFLVVSMTEMSKVGTFSFDLIWGRGYYHLMIPLLNMVGGANKVIYTITTGGELLPERITRNLQADKEAIGIITQCPGTFEKVKDAWKGTRILWQVPNGVDTERFCPAANKPEPFVLGYSGRSIGTTRFQKGIDLILQVCEKNGIPFKIADKQAMIPHSEMPQFYQSLSCYVQPSLSEGCSNSVMEAISCGLPCLIIKGVGYHGQACTEDEVIFVERTEESILAAINRLRNEPEYAERIGKAARAFALRHTWDIIAEKYREILWQALRVSSGREISVPIAGRDWVLVRARKLICYQGTKQKDQVFKMRQKHLSYFADKIIKIDPAKYQADKTALQKLIEVRNEPA